MPEAASLSPLQFKNSGFTHTLFFDCSPSTAKVVDDDTLRKLKVAVKQGKRRDTAGATEDEQYGLYYYNVFDEPVERRASNNSIRRLLSASREPKRNYSEQIKEGYETIVKNYMIDERRGERDYICIFGVGEGAEPALVVARILSKVGVIQEWAFKENFSLVLKFTTSNKYSDDQLENFRSVRTQFSAVDLFCIDKDIPESHKRDENIRESRHCGRERLPDEYKLTFPAREIQLEIAPQINPEGIIAAEAKSAENIAKDDEMQPGRSTK